MGLFGTFFGIFIGLLQFDTKHIDGSIEQLLGGLQTAFITSLIGMGFAIWFKIIQTSYLDQNNSLEDAISPNAIEPKDIHAILTKQHIELTTIAKGIGGNDERSMVGQIQMLRTDINDFRTTITKRQESFEEKLWIQMQTFAEMLSKSATEQVIEALKNVIIEFNNNLTEQFGDNFKRLDESVKKLESFGKLDKVISDNQRLKEQNEYRSPQTRQIMITAKQKDIPAYLYTDEKAWRLLDTRKSVQPSQAKDVLKGQPTRGATRKPTDFVKPWIELIEKGQEVDILIPSIKDKPIKGKLVYVSDIVNPETRTVMVRSEISNSKREIKPDMLVSMLVQSKPISRISVPMQSIVRENDKNHVFVQIASHKYRLREIDVGDEFNGMVAIISGVEEGETIVTDGAFHLNNERKRKELE